MAVTYDTLTNIWSAATIKLVAVTSNTGAVVLIQDQANNGWFLGKPLMLNSNGMYYSDSTIVLVAGNQAIWSTL